MPVLFATTVLLLAGSVAGAATPYCAAVPWATAFDATELGQPQPVELGGETLSAVRYPSVRGHQRMDIDVYNSALIGKLAILRSGSQYRLRFAYSVHSDTTRPVSGVRGLIVAEYIGKALEPTLFCQELISGEADVAREVARDLVTSVLPLAAEALQ